MIHRHHLLVCVAIMLSSTVAFNGQTAFTAETEQDSGFEVDKSMPFHVVDFFGNGPRSGGCPSVMISNSRKLGVEIWSRSLDDSTFQVAAKLQAILPMDKRPNGFLVVFDKPNPESVAKKSEKFALKNFFVCTPRGSGQDLMKRADPDDKYSTIVFVEDRKMIKAVWRFPQGMLNEKAVEDVVNKTRRLLTEKQ